MYYYQQLFTFQKIDELAKDNAIVDGRKGGLLLGPSHSLGGIYFLYEYKDGFRLYGEVEGFEYIICREFSIGNSLVGEINNHDRDYDTDFQEYEFSRSILTIDARISHDMYNSKFIILDIRGGFAIINKHSTKKHLVTVDKINRGIFR